MTTFLISWYSSGWATTAVWAKQFEKLTIGDLLVFFWLGPLGLLFELLSFLGKCLRLSTVIWQKKPR